LLQSPQEAVVQKQLRLFVYLVASAMFLCAFSPLLAQDQDKRANKQDLVDAARKDKGSNTSAKGPGVIEGTQPPPGYRVGVEDDLAIAVWHEPELSQAVTVRPDGMITLPLLNDVKVANLTTEEVQALLVEKLKPFVNDPQVTVSIKAVKSRKVFLVGNVAKQGMYYLNGRMTVLELLSEAGGLGPFAKSKSIYVLRKEAGKDVRLPFNYKKAVSGKGDNPELIPGDMVVVP